MEEETEIFTHLKATLRFRSVRAFERWSGKSVTLRDIIYRTLGVDPDAPPFSAGDDVDPAGPLTCFLGCCGASFTRATETGEQKAVSG
jgi:hypothetical protein